MMNYGSLSYQAARIGGRLGSWGIEALPHVMIRIKRLFPQIASYATGSVHLSDTPENARELEWLIDRFPLEIDEVTAARLRQRADVYRERTHAIDAILAGHIDPIDIGNAGMTPRPHQEQFIALAQRVQRMLLADDLGLGKTISAGFLFGLEGTLPAAVVVPTHLPRHWVEKLAELWPLLRVHVVKKGTPYDLDKIRGMGGTPPDVLVIGYSKLAGWGDALSGQVNTVIFDEVQELRHGHSTFKGTAAAQIARQANFVIGLSATPVFNYGSEIHNIIGILSPGALGSREEFLREWGGGGGIGRERVKNPAALGSYLRDSGLLLRRTRQDVHQDMPDPIIIEESVETDQSALDEIAGDVAAMARLVLNQEADRRQRFVAAGNLDWRLRQATGVAKAPYVAEFVRLLLDSTDRLVLWGWHRACYDIWMDRLDEFAPVLYTGSESPTQKNAAQDAFINGNSRVLIMSLRSGAGLDGLQEVCNVGVFGELDWSPEQHRQCIGRLDRDGQTTTPAIYYLTADDGSDPVISEVLQLKRQQAEPIRDPDKPLFEAVTSNEDRIRMLAKATLQRVALRKESA